MLTKGQYEKQIAESRDRRMKWWREARFGMFIHYGLYAIPGRHEHFPAVENMPMREYEKFADQFAPKPGVPREWAMLAKKAGMKYMVMTTRHIDGFSLWDSKTNPFNSMNYGPKRDIVREFVDACREFDLGVGFYSAIMDLHHPDNGLYPVDIEAQKRFLKYVADLNTELMTNYGKIDILWYDAGYPSDTINGWALEHNQYIRSLQPDIIINDRSYLPEDYGTPEEHVSASNRDWEACMTFNSISWGYVDSEQVKPYNFSAQQILRMLNKCASEGGNLLLNIGPAPDGSVPADVVEPLETVGRWLAENGKAVYGRMGRGGNQFLARYGGTAVIGTSSDGKSIFFWCWIWPGSEGTGIGGYLNGPKSVKLLKDGTPIDFEHKGHRILLKNLPEKSPDTIAGVTVIEMEFDEDPKYIFASYYPQLHRGADIAGENKL